MGLTLHFCNRDLIHDSDVNDLLVYGKFGQIRIH